eukprot:3311209-Rhodomonas_salina.1
MAPVSAPHCRPSSSSPSSDITVCHARRAGGRERGRERGRGEAPASDTETGHVLLGVRYGYAAYADRTEIRSGPSIV